MSFGLPPEEWRDGDADGDDPHGGNHGSRPARCAAFTILQGIRDGPVSVQSDDTEMQDGGRAARDVGRQPDVTQDLAKAPGAGGGVGDADGHDQDGDQEVSHGQGADEIVSWGVELPGEEDGGEHKGIGEGCGHRDDGKEQSQRDLEGPECPWTPSLWGFCSIQGSVGGLLEKAFQGLVWRGHSRWLSLPTDLDTHSSLHSCLAYRTRSSFCFTLVGALHQSSPQ